MELDIEELTNVIYPYGVPGSYKDNEEFLPYVVQLTSCGIEKLNLERSYLKDEKDALLGQTRDLVYANYKTFIHSADCSHTIFKEFGEIENYLEHLQAGLTTLKSSVEDFSITSKQLAQSRQTTSLTLSKHTQLLEILELPQLMDTCVRNGYYEDALDILAYILRLEKKNIEIPIIDVIILEVKGGTRLMLLQLLMQLRSSLTLPQCLKVVGLLRRLDVFSESELRLKFLQARDSWFSNMIKGVSTEDAYQHIIKIVEFSRVHLFDIITQYRAIFSDEDTRFGIGDSSINDQAIFHGWILHKVNKFLSILEKDLAKGVGSNLESLMAQCMFFGQSFSRIGADFRNLLNPIFQHAAFSKFESDVRSANFKFDESLSSFSFMEATQVSLSPFLSEVQDKTAPPLGLMEFYPLAHYMNGLVTAFNGLRQCCPLSLLKDVLSRISASVSKVISATVDLHLLESSGFTANEEKSFSAMCQIIVNGLIPHINACLRLLFPLQNISSVTGIPIPTLQKQNIGQLDIPSLSAVLEPFIPIKSAVLEAKNREHKVVFGIGKDMNEIQTASNTDDNEHTNSTVNEHHKSLNIEASNEVEEIVNLSSAANDDIVLERTEEVPEEVPEETYSNTLYTPQIPSVEETLMSNVEEKQISNIEKTEGLVDIDLNS